MKFQQMLKTGIKSRFYSSGPSLQVLPGNGFEQRLGYLKTVKNISHLFLSKKSNDSRVFGL